MSSRRPPRLKERPAARKPEDGPAPDLRFIDRLSYMLNGAGFTYDRPGNLWRVAVADGSATRLTSGHGRRRASGLEPRWQDHRLRLQPPSPQRPDRARGRLRDAVGGRAHRARHERRRRPPVLRSRLEPGRRLAGGQGLHPGAPRRAHRCLALPAPRRRRGRRGPDRRARPDGRLGHEQRPVRRARLAHHAGARTAAGSASRRRSTARTRRGAWRWRAIGSSG